MAEIQEPDFFERATPAMSVTIALIGVLFLLLATSLTLNPPLFPAETSALGIFAFGLSLFTYSITQFNSHKARLISIEDSQKLARIEKMIEEFTKKDDGGPVINETPTDNEND